MLLRYYVGVLRGGGGHMDPLTPYDPTIFAYIIVLSLFFLQNTFLTVACYVLHSKPQLCAHFFLVAACYILHSKS